MNSIAIQPVTRPFCGTVRVPGSKSITNRALLLAALAEGESWLTGVLFANDTRLMLEALGALGFHLLADETAGTVTIAGGAGNFPNKMAELFCGNSGTTIRFLAAACAVGGGTYTLDGVARMRQRPIGQLVDQLRNLGAQIHYLGEQGLPPIRVRGPLRGGNCTFSDATSSQYISAVLMAAPYARAKASVELIGPVTSEPYVEMTLRMMEQFGVKCDVRQAEEARREIALSVGEKYQARAYAIEPDASNASYFLAAAAIHAGSSMTVEGLGKNSLQGDVAFADVLERMGAAVEWRKNSVTVRGTGRLRGIAIDMNAIPDMVQTLAVAALFAKGPTVARNVGNLRVKETDRLAALENELRKLGAIVETTADSIRIEPPANPVGASIATYDDHRMAMAFSIAGLRVPGVIIEQPECTAKTYPDFFTDLERAVR